MVEMFFFLQLYLENILLLSNQGMVRVSPKTLSENKIVSVSRCVKKKIDISYVSVTQTHFKEVNQCLQMVDLDFWHVFLAKHEIVEDLPMFTHIVRVYLAPCLELVIKNFNLVKMLTLYEIEVQGQRKLLNSDNLPIQLCCHWQDYLQMWLFKANKRI